MTRYDYFIVLAMHACIDHLFCPRNIIQEPSKSVCRGPINHSDVFVSCRMAGVSDRGINIPLVIRRLRITHKEEQIYNVILGKRAGILRYWLVRFCGPDAMNTNVRSVNFNPERNHSMATIALIRHGSTSWNKEGRAQGSSNIPLDQDGINQAKLLAGRLKSGQWNHIYSSGLERAKQTALLIADATGLNVHFDDRLKERSGGQIEGTTEAERIEKWGTGWRDVDLGIESIEEVQKRGKDFLEEIYLRHPGENVLVVSHGALIQFSFIHLVADFPSTHFDNTSLTILKKQDNRWTCELHNCTKHLEHDNNGA